MTSVTGETIPETEINFNCVRWNQNVELKMSTNDFFTDICEHERKADLRLVLVPEDLFELEEDLVDNSEPWFIKHK